MSKKIEDIIVLSERDSKLFQDASENPSEPNSNLKALFSSKKEDWETPDDFFAQMEKQFGKFDLDVCAHPGNAKCKFIGLPEDSLKKNWKELASLCWMNPPYGRGITGKWVEKAYKESLQGVQTVSLLPARTDTKWYKLCHEKAAEIYFIIGRLKFKGAKHSAPFPSMIVVFRKDNMETRRIGLMNNKGEVIKV